VKLISGMIRPERVDAIKQELGCLDVGAISVIQVQDHAPQDHGTMVWRAHAYTPPSSLKMEVRVVVDDDDVDRVVQAFLRVGRTGLRGDGHVCVMPVEHRYDIATGRREAS
jgi:nitrogen regulatory protein PII